MIFSHGICTKITAAKTTEHPISWRVVRVWSVPRKPILYAIKPAIAEVTLSSDKINAATVGFIIFQFFTTSSAKTAGFLRRLNL